MYYNTVAPRGLEGEELEKYHKTPLFKKLIRLFQTESLLENSNLKKPITQ